MPKTTLAIVQNWDAQKQTTAEGETIYHFADEGFAFGSFVSSFSRVGHIHTAKARNDGGSVDVLLTREGLGTIKVGLLMPVDLDTPLTRAIHF